MSEVNIIDGRAFAENVRKKVGQAVAELKDKNNIIPGLAVVLVGDDPASRVYVRNKGQQTRDAGMNSFEHRLDENTSEAELLSLVKILNDDPKVHGILVQLPLPKHLNEDLIIQNINPAKDVDGLHLINIGKLNAGDNTAKVPCTPLGCKMLLKDRLGDLTGKRALVVGRSNLVGKPMAALLVQENCTVTVAHSRTEDLKEECKRADILIAAVGRPKMILGDWIKPGATIIDVGINRIPAPEKGEGKTRLVGDVDFETASKVAGLITPVPGGVGPMTVACLLRNTVTAACEQENASIPVCL